MLSGAARYRAASEASMSALDTEIAAFGAVIRALESIDTETSRIRALGRSHTLWSILVKDLALSSNQMPEPLKTQLISLGQWAMQYSTQAILRKLPVEPLLAVNRNVAEGLAAQRAAPEAAQIDGQRVKANA